MEASQPKLTPVFVPARTDAAIPQVHRATQEDESNVRWRDGKTLAWDRVVTCQAPFYGERRWGTPMSSPTRWSTAKISMMSASSVATSSGGDREREASTNTSRRLAQRLPSGNTQASRDNADDDGPRRSTMLHECPLAMDLSRFSCRFLFFFLPFLNYSPRVVQVAGRGAVAGNGRRLPLLAFFLLGCPACVLCLSRKAGGGG